MTGQLYSVGDARTLRSERRPQGVLDAARRNFSRFGYAAASVEEIAKEAGMAKGTIYVHFKSFQIQRRGIRHGARRRSGLSDEPDDRRYVGGNDVRRASDRFPEPAPPRSSEE
jgi:AcrR family transcriptional regulator